MEPGIQVLTDKHFWSFSSLTKLTFFPLSPTYAHPKMEYCEKSTLRDTIDRGLYEDTSRLWRLFREILDGLAYIHEKVSEYSSYSLSVTDMLWPVLFYSTLFYSSWDLILHDFIY